MSNNTLCLKNIQRLDITVQDMICNSDGKPVSVAETHEYAILFNDTQISEESVGELINSGDYMNDNRLVVMSPNMADRLSGIMTTTQNKRRE